MTMHAEARPAGPDAPWRQPEPPQIRKNALPHDAELIFHHLRKHDPVFGLLSRCAWMVFLGVAVHIRRNDHAYPSQGALAQFTGYSSRTIRRATDELRAAGVLLTWSTRWADGRSAPLRYTYGPAALAAFDVVSARFPRGLPALRPKPLRPATAPAPPPLDPAVDAPNTELSPADMVSSGPADMVADKLLKRIQKEPSSCEEPPTPAASPVVTCTVLAPTETAASPPEQEALYEVTDVDRATAKEALTLRAQRKNPKQRAPAWWDKTVLELVAVRVAQTPGTRDEKLEAQRLALAGAWIASRDQAPTVRFIWENQEHFLEHVERGRKKARNDAWRARREAESQKGGLTPPLSAPLPSAGAEAPSQGLHMPNLAVTFQEVAGEAAPADSSSSTLADERPAQRGEAYADAREEARRLAKRRAEAQQAAAALAAAWGDDGTVGEAPPVINAEQLRAARREVEAELAALKRAHGAPPAS